MISNDKFPKDLTEEEWDKLKKRARLANSGIAGIGLLTYGVNRWVDPKGRAKAYKRANKFGIGTAALGTGSMALSEYMHYKRKKLKKKEKENESKEKD